MAVELANRKVRTHGDKPCPPCAACPEGEAQSPPLLPSVEGSEPAVPERLPDGFLPEAEPPRYY